MKFQVDLNPIEHDITDIRAGLIQHNKPFLEGINKEMIACYALEGDRKIAGIIGDVWGNWLLVKYLWVDEAVRGERIGSELLMRLEQCAISRGCISSLVDTLSFQAKPFYEKHGYQCQMVLENYPLDSSLSFLTKTL
ncbi:GNAT family N-acetyltransferase [uncultured Vibrio sp.]|uniref:GNAT family N-acetyltransferase n=1 Tax=uncultured Vibrio sp. TaxID=114054 RepID=UPI0009195DAD|nr:GNAT family N-acetyltransferase [uncultured Vibrio sp.]OIQ26515.1 MAG: biphenyl 2,3-dioxygenase [Vibrio sp. MedPE-SWchi]